MSRQRRRLRVTAIESIAVTPDETLLVRWIRALHAGGVELRARDGSALTGHALARAYALSSAILGGRGDPWRKKMDNVHCDCGEWSGEQCAWSGPRSETVVVEFMPAFLRASHEAAGNRGLYPANGAQRIRVARACAERMIEVDGDWCAQVSS